MNRLRITNHPNQKVVNYEYIKSFVKSTGDKGAVDIIAGHYDCYFIHPALVYLVLIHL
ncbi:MAG: hypothetical protein ACI8WB_002136 [Phenylobacterium sp.]|jgi:hypothetical protein